MTPAFRLLCACCRWPDDAGRRDAVATAAAAITDWDEVVRLAERHRVEPLVAHGLAAAGLAVPPALEAAVHYHRALSLRDIGETLRIAAALDEAGIVHRFLKGAPLGARAYGNPLLKRSWDIDLLVLPGDAVRTASLLGSLDYVPHVPPRPLNADEFERWSIVSKEAEFNSRGGETLELHWRVSDHPLLLGSIDADSPGRKVALLDSLGVATLADDANLAYLAVHGTAHAWARLKWLADFHALLMSSEDPLALIDRAKHYPVGRALDAALQLARFLFDPAPDDQRPSAGLAGLGLGALLSDENSPAIDHFVSRTRLRLGSGAKYLLYEVKLRARGTLDRIDCPLPRRWRWLYPFLRVPLWIRRYLRNRRGRNNSGVF